MLLDNSNILYLCFGMGFAVAILGEVLQLYYVIGIAAVLYGYGWQASHLAKKSLSMLAWYSPRVRMIRYAGSYRFGFGLISVETRGSGRHGLNVASIHPPNT